MTQIYHIFLSCDDIMLKGENLEQYLNRHLLKENGEDLEVKCISNFRNINKFAAKLNSHKDSWIYIINTNKEPDWRIGWEIGYMVGKGNRELIVCCPKKKMTNIFPDDIQKIIEDVPENVESFLMKIQDKLLSRTPQKPKFRDSLSTDWNDQRKTVDS